MEEKQERTSRRRWVPIGCLAILLVGGLALPLVLEVAIKGALVERLEEDLHANVELDAVHVGWTGKLGIGGLRVTDDSGFQHLLLRDVRIDLGLRELLAGNGKGTLDLVGLDLAVRQDDTGAWSFERFLVDEAVETKSGDSAPSSQAGPPGDKLPMHFSARFDEVTLHIETPSGEWTQTFDGALLGDSLDDTFEIEKLNLTGDLAQGRAHGMIRGFWSGAPVADPLSAELTYVPDRIAPLIVSLLAEQGDVRLSGADPEPLEFELRGPLDRVTLEEQLRDLQSHGRLGLGQLSILGFDLGGLLDVSSQENGAAFTGELRLDGGSLRTQGSATLFGEQQGAQLSVNLSAIPVDGQIGPLLARVHPIFALDDDIGGVDLAGFLQADLDIEWRGNLQPDTPQGGWDIRALAPLDMRGKIEFQELQLAGSPLLKSLQKLLGGDAADAWQLDPLEFHLDGGQLAYDKPWTWTIGDVQTRFEGGIGLDGGLNLVWRIPVDDALVRQRSELKPLLGESLSVPLSGSLRSPVIEWQQAVGQLLQTAARARAEQAAIEELGKVLGSDEVNRDVLDSVLQGDLGALGGILGEKAGTKDDPNALLKQADKLWDAGEKAEAAKLYQRLRNDFPLSPAYLMNRSRVKSRRKG